MERSVALEKINKNWRKGKKTLSNTHTDGVAFKGGHQITPTPRVIERV